MAVVSLPLPVISSWDPRAASSGSIDPLGALRAYNTIAGFLLPGVTTITTRVRYLSWLCAGLRLLDETAGAPVGGTAGRSRRKQLLTWERFLVLATGYYADSAGAAQDAPEWRGLRGISYVRSAMNQGKTSTEFELLKNQAGVGGVGTYWVSMVNGGLVEDASAELTDRGALVAEGFLKRLGAASRQTLLGILAGDKSPLSREELIRWGKHASLDVSSGSAAEIRGLRDALLEPKTHRLMSMAIHATSNPDSTRNGFMSMERALRKQKDDTAGRMAAVMETTRAFESVHAGLLDRFDRLRALDMRGFPVDRKVAAAAIGGSGDLPARSQELDRCLTKLPDLPKEVAAPVRQFFQNVRPILEAPSGDALLREICLHHDRVQAGKLDASRQPKQPWVQLQDGHLTVSPRFAIDGGQAPREATAFTHPYRIESFAGMLSELEHPGAAQ